MSIRIKEINVKRLGPIDKFSHEFGDVNLIYGHNEKGKTYLVEFLLQSLFKRSKDFGLRDINPSGKIIVTGIHADDHAFTPKTKKKLEDYWEKQNKGMPTNIARLLVVKGAELGFGPTKGGGISKSIIKSFLSSELTLDIIQDNIQKIDKKAKIENGRVEGRNSGKIKSQRETLDELIAIEKLLYRIDRDISGGTISKHQSEIELINDEIKKQELAKRYQAYLLNTQINSINTEIGDFAEKDLDALINKITEHGTLSKQKDSLIKKLEESRKKSQHYSWLKNLREVYKEITRVGVIPIVRRWAVLSLITFLLGIALVILGGVLSQFDESVTGIVLIVIGVGAFVVSAISVITHIKQYQKQKDLITEQEELKRFRDIFFKKIGIKLTDIATIITELERVEIDYFNVQTHTNSLAEQEDRLGNIHNQIKNSFLQFSIEDTKPKRWKEHVIDLNNKKIDMEKKREDLRVRHSSLNVDEENYLIEDPGKAFNDNLLIELNSNLQIIEREFGKEDEIHTKLKLEIIGYLQGIDSEDWNILIDKLRLKRDEFSTEYKIVTSQIIAAILVADVIKEAREHEDENIKTSLKLPIIRDPLFQITQRYKDVTFDGEVIRVLNEYEEFDVADLSTGAREQVLLALRIGFAAKIMGNESAFLILDDAFQYSDWVKRPFLVETVFDLAKRGWQIIYFSMDDHIQGLFDELGEKVSDLDYKKIVLAEGN